MPAETQAIDWDSYIKQFRSWATMLLRLFASRHRPLILVIDDYQWMEASERTLQVYHGRALDRHDEADR
jgi:ATP/maltotriose-dependent transcriptional regulator MalT